jgi:hypothetical protein
MGLVFMRRLLERWKIAQKAGQTHWERMDRRMQVDRDGENPWPGGARLQRNKGVVMQAVIGNMDIKLATGSFVALASTTGRVGISVVENGVWG